MKISYYTLGCRLNQAEVEEVLEKLEKESLNLNFISNPKKADLVILGACAVTENASQRTRQMIRAFKKSGAKVFVLGCLENILPEVDYYAANLNSLLKEIEKLLRTSQERKRQERNTKELSSPKLLPKSKQKVRAFVKIQTGCSFQCSFCYSRFFRGPSFSLPPSEIIQKINEKINRGAKEIVLTGMNLGLYSASGLKLKDLIAQILAKTEVKRLRLSSMHPALVTKDLLSLFHSPRLCPHLHLSVQSGSNRILRLMKRNYTIGHCQKIIQEARKINPYFSFSADFIVGFPGETEKDFLATCHFLKEAKLVRAHIFPFSPRFGTKAFSLPKQVEAKTKKERVKILGEIAKESFKDYIGLLYGQKRPVLFEGKRNGFWEGYTPEFLRIKIKSRKNLKGEILDCLISQVNLQTFDPQLSS